MRFFYALVLVYFLSGVFLSNSAPASSARDQDLRTDNNYKSSLLELGTSYKARLYCSCRYQMQLSEKYCQRLASVRPEVFNVSSDSSTKIVEAAALLFLHKARAKHVHKELGCALERS